MTGHCALPCTEKMLFPATMLDATKLASPLMVWVPVKYVPLEMVWSLVPGVMVAAAFVVTEAVKETAEFPAVPEET